MNNWKETTLGQVCSKIGSGATPRGGQDSYKEEGISLIRSQNVLDLDFTFDGLAFIDQDQADDLANVEVKNQDVLINITGDSVARVCMVPESVLPARVNQHVSILRANATELNPCYLKYYLINRSIKQSLLNIANSGATRNALTKGQLEIFPILLPALSEQKAIAEILSSFDDKIDLLRRQNKTLESIAQALFKEWFVKFRVNGNQLPLNSHTGLPEGWRQGKLNEFIKELIPGEWGQDTQDTYYTEKVVCLRGTDLPDIKSGSSSRAPFRFIKRNKLEQVHIVNGDLIVEISGGTIGQSTGRITYVNQEIIDRITMPFVASNFCRVIRLKDISYQSFIYSYWEHLYTTGIFFSFENGTTGIQNLNLKGFLDYDIIIPHQEMIQRYCLFAEPSFIKIQKFNSQIQTLSRLRDLLLPKLMKSEFMVKEL